MKIIFNETTKNVNKKNMRFEGLYENKKGETKIFKKTLKKVLKAEILTKNEALEKGFDEVDEKEYLHITLDEKDLTGNYQTLTWANHKCSLRQAR